MIDVSVVVCVRNCAELVAPCLESVIENGVAEVIVVDGCSTDGTPDVARRYTSHILDDGGKGLAHARNLGAQAATSRYVAFVGPDNVMPPRSIERMIQAKESNGWTGVSAQTRLQKPTSYLARSMDRYKAYRFVAGERSVIGTPTLFDSRALESHLFDAALSSSDDADLCQRLINAGHRLGIADVVVLEHGTFAAAQMFERWRWYGQSDAEFYRKYSPGWTRARKLRSALHPVKSELIAPTKAALARGDVAILPFLLAITMIRYAGWAQTALRARAKS